MFLAFSMLARFSSFRFLGAGMTLGKLGMVCALVASVVATTQVRAQGKVKVESGELQGVTQDDVVSYKGIPFAAPPVGDLRWKAPQPAPHWSGVRKADQYGHDCMQLPFPGDAAPLGTPPAEDCLVLNVWVPKAPASKKLPVMVWIYGGGYVNGGSSPAVYDGAQFAKQGVVFVSFNYRLGRFGFFAHPALTAEAGSGPTGNFAFMDQIAALKWVQQNIAAFGGDAGKVTLFGESAGGGSVLTMMTSPLARGLFQQAIIESGGGRDGLGGMANLSTPAANGKPSAESDGVNFAKAKGITATDASAIAALRKLPADQVVDGLNMASMFAAASTYAGPMIDGKLIIETPQQALLAGHQMKIPTMIGANNMDIGFSFAKSMDEVFAPFGAAKDQAAAAYNSQNSTNVRAVGTAVAADILMVEPGRFVAREVAASGQPSYEYRFSYVAVSMRKEWRGAPHATEIPYVFDTVKARYGADLAPADAAAAKAANTYWATFAKTGDPNCTGLPKWPQYSAASDTLLDFTDDGPVAMADPWKARLDLIEGLANNRK
jgi:para-nitrobenzyl esterase